MSLKWLHVKFKVELRVIGIQPPPSSETFQCRALWEGHVGLIRLVCQNMQKWYSQFKTQSPNFVHEYSTSFSLYKTTSFSLYKVVKWINITIRKYVFIENNNKWIKYSLTALHCSLVWCLKRRIMYMTWKILSNDWYINNYFEMCHFIKRIDISNNNIFITSVFFERK